MRSKRLYQWGLGTAAAGILLLLGAALILLPALLRR